MKMPFSRIVFHLSVIILVMLFTLSVLADIKILWGLNMGKFLPQWWQWLIIGAIWLTLIPSVNRSVVDSLSKLSNAFLKKKRSELIVVLLLIGVITSLFVLLRSQAVVLGDGMLRLNQVYKGQFFLPTEIGDFFIHSILYQEVFRPYNIPPIIIYHILSPIGGVIFLVGIYKLARYLYPDNFLTLFLMFASSGLIVMYFGYVESYALVAGLLPWVILSALKTVDRKRSRLGFIIIYLFAVILHPLAIILLSGLLVGLVILKEDRDQNYYRKCYAVFLVSAMILIFIIYLLQASGFLMHAYLLPFFPSDKCVHGLATSLHLWDIFNWLTLAALPALPYFLSLPFDVSKQGLFYSRKGLFAFLLLLPSIAFIIFFVPHLNGPRDWDLFSLPVFLLLPGCMILFLSDPKRRLSGGILPLIMAALFIAGSFVSINHSKLLSADRFEEVINVTKKRNLYIDYSLLYDISLTEPQLYNRRLYYARRAWEQPPYKAEDSVFMADQLARLYIHLNDGRKAKYFVDQAIRADSNDVTGYLAYIAYLEKFGTPDRTLEQAEILEAKFPDDAIGRMNAGLFYTKIGRFDKAEANLEMAYRLDSLDETVVANYGTLLYHLGEFDRCIQVLNRDIKYAQSGFQRYLALSHAYRAKGDRNRAIEYYYKATSLAASQQQTKLLATLKSELGL
jgi:Tfp pilus assembly protein PilF